MRKEEVFNATRHNNWEKFPWEWKLLEKCVGFSPSVFDVEDFCAKQKGQKIMSKDSFFFVELRSQMCFDIYINMFLSSFFQTCFWHFSQRAKGERKRRSNKKVVQLDEKFKGQKTFHGNGLSRYFFLSSESFPSFWFSPKEQL